MDRPSVVRLLRIAVSAVCLMVCALLIVLWVRSYFREDGLVWGVTDKRGLIVGSMDGVVTMQRASIAGDNNVVFSKWFVDSYLPGDGFWLPREEVQAAVLGFRFRIYPHGNFTVAMPHWSLALASGALAAAVWFKQTWRFSLRTLLIATTLIAVVLGLVVVFGQ